MKILKMNKIINLTNEQKKELKEIFNFVNYSNEKYKTQKISIIGQIFTHGVMRLAIVPSYRWNKVHKILNISPSGKIKRRYWKKVNEGILYFLGEERKAFPKTKLMNDEEKMEMDRLSKLKKENTIEDEDIPF